VDPLVRRSGVPGLIARAASGPRRLRRSACGLVQNWRTSSLVRNSVYILATAVVTSLMGYLYWVVAARSYSEHDVGLAAALIAAMTLGSTVASLGPAFTLVQMLPQRRGGRAWSLTLNTALAAGGTASLALGVGLALVLPGLSSDFAVLGEDLAYPSLLVAGVVLTTVGILLDYTFVAERAAGKMFVRNLLFSVVRIPLLLAPVAVMAGLDAIGVLGAWVLATAASCVAAMPLVGRLGRSYASSVRGVVRHGRSMLSALAGHHLISMGGALPMYLLPMLVAALLSPTANAYFYTAWMVCNALFMVPFAVSSSLFAEGSHAAHELHRQVRASTVITAALLAPLMLVLLLGSRYVMAAFGSRYVQHVPPLLTLLALSAIPEAITSLYISVLRVEGRLRFAAALSVGMGALTMGLAWVLLRDLGLIGAGWAVLLAWGAGSAIVAGDVAARRWRGGSGAVKRRSAGASAGERPEQLVEPLWQEGALPPR
jgi:O-antigen/teichoic acid export membrane protein